MNSDASSRPLAVRLMRVAIGVLLLVGGLYYAGRTLPTAPLLQDPREAEALALVQNHPAIGFPSILEAMNEHVRAMKERGQGVRLGEWRVKQVDGTIYEIRVQLRDQSVRGQWFEREFIWHAHLDFKRVNAASLPADGVTPKAPDSDQRAVPSFPSPPAS